MSSAKKLWEKISGLLGFQVIYENQIWISKKTGSKFVIISTSPLVVRFRHQPETQRERSTMHALSRPDFVKKFKLAPKKEQLSSPPSLL